MRVGQDRVAGVGWGVESGRGKTLVTGDKKHDNRGMAEYRLHGTGHRIKGRVVGAYWQGKGRGRV